jgi:hypothetical protein
VTVYRTRPLQLPEHWTPAEALAVFELLDLLRDHLWLQYGPDIQHAFRDQINDHDPRQRPLCFDPDAPF